MMRIGITLVPLLILVGCSHLQTIPAPTEDWSYVEIQDFDQIRDAEYCLLLNYNLQGIGDIGLQTIFFEKQTLPQKRILHLGNMYFADGDGWSSDGSYKVEIGRKNITLHMDNHYISRETEYEYEEDIDITYSKRGISSSGNLRCSWEWIKLNGSKQWNELSKKTGVDWVRIFNQQPEKVEVKRNDR